MSTESINFWISYNLFIVTPSNSDASELVYFQFSAVIFFQTANSVSLDWKTCSKGDCEKFRTDQVWKNNMLCLLLEP